MNAAKRIVTRKEEESEPEPSVSHERDGALGEETWEMPTHPTKTDGGGELPPDSCLRPWCYEAAVRRGGLCARCSEEELAAALRAHHEHRRAELPCNSCGEPRGLGADAQHRCKRCQDKAFEELMRTTLESVQRQFEESPHRCRGGCGEHMLAANRECTDCGERREDLEQRRSCARAHHTPERYHWARFDAPELHVRVIDPAMVARVRAACVNDTRLIVLVGSAGVGKTSLGFAGARQLAHDRKVQIRYQAAQALALARVQAPLGEEARTVTDAIAAPLLILDDLGVDPNVPTSAVADVIYARHQDCRTTIVTTSLNAVAVASRYGDGVARRIFEQVEGSYVFTLEVPSCRGR
jgi:DNA replication protein DnaC